jgi:hypothetical protein
MFLLWNSADGMTMMTSLPHFDKNDDRDAWAVEQTAPQTVTQW